MWDDNESQLTVSFEDCRICGREVLYSESVHTTMHTGDDGVVDFYVCGTCYEEELAPLVAGHADEGASEADPV